MDKIEVKKRADDLGTFQWPLMGYAPGYYMRPCLDCKAVMTHCDKRATQCLSCALTSILATRTDATPAATDVAALVEADRNTDTRGYVVGNGDRTKWRKWLNGDCIWTDDPREATRFFFRSDANAVHHEDEDAWCIIELRQALAPFTKGQDDE